MCISNGTLYSTAVKSTPTACYSKGFFSAQFKFHVNDSDCILELQMN